ncbi:MAG TPA: hypothetical protein VKT82_12445 [Ktedonobacterales bacterium]|nr:hypothetical protein [Ktedonobacterales bacterium]
MSSAQHVAASYREQIQAAQNDPEQIEQLYQTARRARRADQFAQDIEALHQESADNILYTAWHYRLQHSASEDWFARIGSHWQLAIALSVVLGLLLWGLSGPSLAFGQGAPLLAFVGAPIVALFLAGFFFLVTRAQVNRLAWSLIGLAAFTAYVLLMLLRLSGTSEYLPLAALHLVLLAWGALAIFLAGWRLPTREIFAFLLKSLETVGTGGVYVIIGGIFVGLTYLLFDAIGVELNDTLVRLLVIGGAGLIPLVAVLSVYDPKISLSAQEFRRGFARIVLIGVHALLPLTLLILVLFLLALPFNFFQAYDNRITLVVFNVLLFAILGLLIGLIPLNAEEFSPRYQQWLRRGTVLLVGLVLLVSIYALSAIVYRTAQDGLTMNRLTVIGWNSINIVLLGVLLYRMLRPGSRFWGEAAQTIFRPGAYAYLAWGGFLLIALPWLF